MKEWCMKEERARRKKRWYRKRMMK